MPFQVTDEALDGLESASDEERAAFELELSDVELSQIEAAIPAWRERKKGMGAASGPPSAPVQPELSVAPVEITSGVGQPEVPGNPQSFGETVLGALSPVGQLGNLADMVSPGVVGKVKQSVHDLGMKAGEGLISASKATMPQLEGLPLGLPGAREQELGARSVMSSVLGDDILNGMEDLDKSKAVNDLEGKLGTTGTAAALAGAQTAGNIPQMLIGLKGSARGAAAVGEGAGALKKLAGVAAGNAMENMAIGQVQGTLAGADPVMQAVMDMTMGAGFPVVGAGLGKAAQWFRGNDAVKLIDAINRQMQAELEKLPSNMVFEGAAARTSLAEGGVPAVTRLPHTDPNFKPSWAVVSPSKETGKLVAYIGDYRTDGTKQLAEMPVDTLEGAQKFKVYAEKHDLPLDFSNKADLISMSPEHHQALLPNKGWYTDTVGTADAKKMFTEDGRSLKVSEKTNPGSGPRDAVDTQSLAKMDEPPAVALGGDMALVVDDVGHVKAQMFPADSPELHAPTAIVATDPTKVNPRMQAVVADYGQRIEPDAPTNAGKSPVHGKPPPPPKDALAEGLSPPEKTPVVAIKRKAILGYLKDPVSQEPIPVKDLGEDPMDPGMHLYFWKADAPLLVRPSADFHPAMDVPTAQGLRKDHKRIPVAFDVTKIRPETLDALETVGINLSHAVRRQPTLGEKLFGGGKLVSKHHLGASDLMDKIRALQASQVLEGSYKAIRQRLGDMVGGASKLGKMTDLEFDQVVRGRLSVEEFGRKFPKIKQDMLERAKSILDERTRHHEWLVTRGYIEDKKLDDSVDELYAARLYAKNLLPPGKWAKLAPAEVIARATDGLVSQIQKAGEVTTPAYIQQQLMRLLNADDPLAMLHGMDFMKSKAFDRLRKRNEIPLEIRELMGEIKSGTIRLAHTVGMQRGLVARLELFEGLAADPKYYSHGPQPHLDVRQVPANRRLYGELAGGYVAPELYDFVVQLPKAGDTGLNLFKAIHGFRKGNLISSPRAVRRSTIGNLLSSVLAGGLDLFRPVQSGAALIKAAQAMWDHWKDPSGKTGLGGWMLSAKASGSDWGGWGEMELSGMDPYVKGLMKSLADAKPGTDAFTLIEKLVMHTGWMKAPAKVFGALLDVSDRYFRIANFIMLTEKFKAKPGKFLPGVLAADIDKAAMELASRRINDSFMNAEFLGKSIEAARTNGMGVAAPFITSASEEARIYGMLPKRILTEELEVLFRLLSWAAVGAAGFGANSLARQSYDGPSDATVDAALANTPDRGKWWKKGPLAAPWFDEKGRPEIWDVTQDFLPMQMSTGHPDDPLFNRFLANIVSYPFGGGTEEAVMQGVQATGLVRPPPDRRKLFEGEGGFLPAAEFMMRQGGVPAIATQSVEMSRKTGLTGMRGQNEETWTPRQAALSLAGAPIVGPANPTSPAGQMESAGEIAELQRQMRTIAKQMGLNGKSPQDIEARLQPIMARLRELSGKMQNRQQITDKYRQEQKK